MHTEAGLLRTIDVWEASEGAPAPLGATWVEALGAYNFAIFSRSATAVTLLLYRESDPVTPVARVALDPRHNKTGLIWHCMVPAAQLNGATLYAYRVAGPFAPERGLRHDPAKILLDPYALEVYFPPAYSREACARPGPTDGVAPLGILPTREVVEFDWGADPRPRHTHDLVVYELHVKGFTARAGSGVIPAARGTFAGLIEKIPYLTELGVTVVELLPVHQYDPQEGNYWGYMTLNFFSPHRSYALGEPIVEFRQMVKAFHEAGMQVWIDVVYNHTSEGDASGPTYSYRGLDNRSYYLLRANRADYNNDTGCGNTLRCGHPAVRGLIIESIRHWSEEMHIDGYRFDLASILTRPADGAMTISSGLIGEISAFAYSHDVTLVAEAWDIASYQLGRSFPGQIWRQWNGKFRDDIRSFVRGDPGKVGALMQRLYGSDDLFPDSLPEAYRPYQSVNFITAHDGFCLYDLTAYNEKHNYANGHANTDGSNDNYSWNCGWEGDYQVPPEVMGLRRRQVKNFFALLMLANGTPMFCAGDEFLNTQGGNNNPYNQDNPTTWLDWGLLDRNRDIFRFFRLMIAFRKAHRSIGRSTYWREDISWYGVGPHVDLSEGSRCLAYCLRGASLHDGDLYVMINAYWEPVAFTVQEGQAGQWRRVVDTSLPSPDDITEPGREPPVPSLDYLVGPRSVVVLYRPLLQRPETA